TLRCDGVSKQDCRPKNAGSETRLYTISKKKAGSETRHHTISKKKAGSETRLHTISKQRMPGRRPGTTQSRNKESRVGDPAPHSFEKNCRVGDPAPHPAPHKRLRLEPKHDTGLITEGVLPIAQAAGEPGRQGIGGVESSLQVIDLHRPDCEVLADTDIHASTESHSERVRACHSGRNAPDDRDVDACAKAGTSSPEQSMGKDGTITEMSGHRGPEQERVQPLVR